MFDTHVTVVGNVLNEPEFKRIKNSEVLVASFKVASNSRRFDRRRNEWVDGNSLRVRVNCFRRLAESVGMCVHVGDPVVVTGRLYSRDWTGDDQVRRLAYEVEALTVGHDLSRGYDKFTRHRVSLATSATEDEETEKRVAGEPAEAMPELNNRIRSRSYDQELGGFVTSVEHDPYDFGINEDPFSDDALSNLTTAGDDDEHPDEAARITVPIEDEPDGGDEGGGTTEEGDGDGGETVEPGRKRRRRQPVGV